MTRDFMMPIVRPLTPSGKCQPNAVIYIQGLIPLNEDVIAATGGASYLTNEHLRVYNDLMQQAAQEKQVVFLDLYPEFVG